MFLRRTNGGQPVMRLRDEMNQLFNEVFENGPLSAPFVGVGRRAFPAINVWENETALYAEAEVPGLKMDNIEVFVQGNELTIKGARGESEQPGVTFHRRERGVGEFSRVLQLPLEIDAEKVQAALRDGVLTITLPKAAAVMPRRIEVKG